MLDLKKERKSNKNLIFLHIKHSMVVKNDALMNSNHYPPLQNIWGVFMTPNKNEHLLAVPSKVQILGRFEKF